MKVKIIGATLFGLSPGKGQRIEELRLENPKLPDALIKALLAVGIARGKIDQYEQGEGTFYMLRP